MMTLHHQMNAWVLSEFSVNSSLLMHSASPYTRAGRAVLPTLMRMPHYLRWKIRVKACGVCRGEWPFGSVRGWSRRLFSDCAGRGCWWWSGGGRRAHGLAPEETISPRLTPWEMLNKILF